MNTDWIRYLVACLAAVSLSMRAFGQPETTSQQTALKQAYENWQSILDAHPELEDAFFFAADYGPQALRNSVKALLDFGPNQTPFLVEQYRKETNFMRLYRLTKLLNKVSGINLYSGHEREVLSNLSLYRDRFIKEWDSGEIAAPDKRLADLRKRSTELTDVMKVNAENSLAFRRYGVYGIPFLIREIKRTNSPELFATFLIITDHQQLYAEYLDNPKDMFTTVDSKLAFIKNWHSQHQSKLDSLGALYDSIKVEVR